MEMKKRVLGKGLSALIPDSYSKIIHERQNPASKVTEAGMPQTQVIGLEELRISNIKPSPDQPRKHFPEAGIEENVFLVASYVSFRW